MAATEASELALEEETDEVPFVEFDISVSPSDPTLELLADQVQRGDIVIPFYQRRYVWKIEQASRLIESFLMGLPVPQVFLYVNSDGLLEVIDGQQRIMSVKYFFDGLFGEADHQNKKQVFRLKGLAERSEYNGKTFNELSPKDQRKLKNSTLRTINIKQLKPSARNDSVFHIFERLNTGGTQLKPQEIRNAVYRGPIVEQLKTLNDLPKWQKILGLKRPDKNQKDVELVLRLFSLFGEWVDYEKPMLNWLNATMQRERSFDSKKAEEFLVQFPVAVEKIHTALKKPFRPNGVLNAAVLEAVILALMEHPEITVATLPKRYEELLNDETFLGFTRGATTDSGILRSRITTASSVLANG